MNNNHDHHGNLCTCRLLAEAAGCDPQTIKFEFCRSVLMKHWLIECNHGCQHGLPEAKRSKKWHNVGPMDPIKAILIKNE